MPTQTETRPTEKKESIGRGYWAALGFGAGLFITVALSVVVLIVTAPSPTSSPEPTLPAAGLDAITVVGTEFAFNPADMVLNPSASITLDNQGVVVHNLEIEGVAGFKVEAQAGTAAVGTIDVTPGEYVVFCSIPGHREAGMEGALTVATG